MVPGPVPLHVYAVRNYRGSKGRRALLTKMPHFLTFGLEMFIFNVRQCMEEKFKMGGRKLGRS